MVTNSMHVKSSNEAQALQINQIYILTNKYDKYIRSMLTLTVGNPFSLTPLIGPRQPSLS